MKRKACQRDLEAAKKDFSSLIFANSSAQEAKNNNF